MVNSSIRVSGNVGGVAVDYTIAKSAASGIASKRAPNRAYAGTLSTRSGNSAGVVTLSAGHGITNGTVDVYWAGGRRYGATASVSTNDVTLSGGAGDNLPLQGTEDVRLCKVVTLDVDFDGAKLVMLAIGSKNRAQVVFSTATPTVVLAVEIDPAVAGKQGYEWHGVYTNPIGANVVSTITISTAKTAAIEDPADSINIGALYNSDT